MSDTTAAAAPAAGASAPLTLAVTINGQPASLVLDAAALAALGDALGTPFSALPVRQPLTGGEWVPLSTDGKTLDGRAAIGQLALLDAAFASAVLAKAGQR